MVAPGSGFYATEGLGKDEVRIAFVLSSQKLKEAMELLNKEDFDILITDLKMPEMDGMALVKNCLNICPQTSVIIITAHASVESAIEALRMGAFDYILKPFDFDDLLLKVQRLLNHKELALENQALRQEVEEKYNFSNI